MIKKNRLRNGLPGILLPAALLALLIAVVVQYAPAAGTRSTDAEAAEIQEITRLNTVPETNAAVQPLMPVENCWDIEDTHAQASSLVTRMTMNGSELGYDALSGTFYCTLGMNNEAWPELPLSAAGAEGLQAAWTDDYAYDDVASAISSGTAYQLIAWTDTAYEYFHVVFTGLPIITLHVQDWTSMNDDYMPSRVTVSAAGCAGIDSPAEAHLRSGGDNRSHDKLSYRVSFKTVNRKERLKDQTLSVLDMGEDSDWLLIASPKDPSNLLNHLGWDMWNKWNPDGDAFALLPNRLVELFVEDQYQGIYGIQPPVRPKKELARVENGMQGIAVRIISTHNPSSRPQRDELRNLSALLELRYRPDNMTDDGALALFDEYAELCAREDMGLPDDEFVARTEKIVDLRNMLNYWLYFQAIGLGDDNVWNNVWLWAVPDSQGQMRFSISPWDLDRCLEGVEEEKINRIWTLPLRLLDLNALGSREYIHELWKEKCSTILSREAFAAWLQDAVDELNLSGAYARESLKWQSEATELDTESLMNKGWDRITVLQECLDEEWPVIEK